MTNFRKARFNWRLIFVQAIANTIALGLTVLLLPGIHMAHDSFVLELLASGVLFGLLNAFVRPILQFVMFSFLFITFGSVLVVINIIILWMLASLTPDRFQIDNWWSLIIAGVLILIFGAFFETLLGLQPPILDDGPTMRTREQYFSLGSAPVYVSSYKPEGEATLIDPNLNPNPVE